MLRELIRKKLPVFTMAFASYQRYKFVSDLLIKEECKTILDVGGGSERFLRRFLPNKQSFTLDKEGGDIIGDGTNLSFPKNHFDAIISLDTLEHIKKKDRKKFVQELIRVAKKCVILSLPVDDPILRSAERECNALYHSMFGKEHQWLEEHIKNGLPTRKEMNRLLNGYSVKTYSICNISRWKKMLKLSFILEKARLLLLLSVINSVYVTLYGTDSREPTYTKVFFVKGVNQ